jgi:hypothetical protein
MFFYLTTNEFYSGIYQGQVVDVVDFLSTKLNVRIRLVAFIPIKGFFKRRAEIKAKSPYSLVLPMTPKQSIGDKWMENRFLLFFVCRIYRCKGIIARGPFATLLALSAKDKGYVSKVCYDGRGALAAEEEEYKVFPIKISKMIRDIEKNAVLLPDTRICITKSLLNYWVTEYGYSGDKHFIIPGTLNNSFVQASFGIEHKLQKRKELGYNIDDIILIYAGSTEGWQSFQMIYEFLSAQFQRNSLVKVIFLSKSEKNIVKLTEEFPEQVSRMWLKPSEVREIMYIGDYGLIIREKSITNKVAMPTKFPEYLACGLNVIANDAVDDVSEFILNHNCGLLLDNSIGEIVLNVNSEKNIANNRDLALKYYNKHDPEFMKKYVALMEVLRG